MKNIVLTGFMGTGKTEVSKILAGRLKKQRLCIDDMIEWEAGKSISEIFKEEGEEYFRKIESKMAASASKNKDVIIDAGGGAIINELNLKRLKENGIVFCLTASVDAILQRTRHYTHRPLLDVEDPQKKIGELLTQRQKYYEKADRSIDTTNKTPEGVADEILEYMASLEKEQNGQRYKRFITA